MQRGLDVAGGDVRALLGSGEGLWAVCVWGGVMGALPLLWVAPLAGRAGALWVLQGQGKGQRSPESPRGKVRGAAHNLEGVREFRVCLWFALPSSSSPLPACGRQLRSGLSSSSLVWVWQNKRAKLSALLYKYSGFFRAV